MFKIDKSSVNYLEANKGVVIKQWVSNDAEDEQQELLYNDERLVSFEQEQLRRHCEEQVQESLKRAQTLEQELLQQARVQAAKIVQQAKQEAQEIEQKAYERGFEQGHKTACEQQEALSAQYQAWFDELVSALKWQEQEREELVESSVLELSLEIAQKVVSGQLEERDDLFLGLIKEAILKLNAEERVKIHLNQREFERFFQEGSGFLSTLLPGASFDVIQDDAVCPGGLVLKSSKTVLTTGIDRRFEKIAAALEIENQ